MFLQTINIKNFRGLCDLSLELDETTVLIGSNNTGKTSILDALRLCMSRTVLRRNGAFADYDYHLADESVQPQDAPPIEITLTFKEKSLDEWPDPLIQTLNGITNTGDDGLQSTILYITSAFDSQTSDFNTTWSFLNPEYKLIPRVGSLKNISELQRLAPVFYLAALRDAAQQFRAQSSFWGPFVRSMKMDAAERKEIEDELGQLNQRVLDAHEAFGPVLRHLQETGSIMPLDFDNPVCLEALPAKIFDMLSRTQVLLTGKTGARLPIGRHGDGTQSLAVICLFKAFLEAKLAEGYGPESQPILAIEEPEAHLHPSAVRAVGRILTSLAGQKIITTHSGDLVAAVPIESLRRLCRVDGHIKVHSVDVDSLTSEDKRKIDYHLRQSRGCLMFARFWLLVEGETDCTLLHGCSEILGYDLFSKGICCVAYQSSAGSETLIKLADQLGISWLLVADNDDAGNKYVKIAKSQLSARPVQDHVLQIPFGNIEVYLCNEGFGTIYESNVAEQKKSNIKSPYRTPEYWKEVVNAQSNAKAKPDLVLEVVHKIKEENAPMPVLIRQTIETVLHRAAEAE